MKILQIGRSMIEMLGVLAIIGVMSIGGIAGYRIAMNKYQANVILEDVNRFAFTIVERSPLPDGEISPADFVKTTPYTITAENDVEENYFYIEVHGVPKGVCKELLNKKSNDFEIYAGTQGNYLYQDDDDICDDMNRMLFVFGDTDGLCSHTPGENEEACVHGCVCEGACLNDVKTGEKVCCDNNTQKACDGTCHDECDENHRFDNDSCSCKCFPITGCADDGYTDDCQCTKCTDGYTPIGGSCGAISCSGGTEGSNYYECGIDGIGCGFNCSADGDVCGHGICLAKNCSEGEDFVHILRSDGHSSYQFACRHKVSDDYICYRWVEKTVSIDNASYGCYKDGKYCCDTNDTTTFRCISGLCGDEKRCTDLKSDATLVNNYCVFPNKLTCAWKNGSWECYKYGYYCGDCDDDKIKTDQCCKGTGCRVSKDRVGSYNATTKRCEYTVGEEPNRETISCTITDITENKQAQTCFVGDAKRCRIYISKPYATVSNYTYGRCSAVEANCPEGTEYGYIEGLDYYDCKNKTANAPVCGYVDRALMCYYNGSSCGYYCDYFGHNCRKLYDPSHCTSSAN